MLTSIPEENRTDCWWFVGRDGVPIRGDHGGGVRLLMEIERTNHAGRVLRSLKLSPAVDAFDYALSRVRKHLGRFVPDEAVIRRYP